MLHLVKALKNCKEQHITITCHVVYVETQAGFLGNLRPRILKLLDITPACCFHFLNLVWKVTENIYIYTNAFESIAAASDF